MTNWIAASLVTWLFDISNLKNMVEGNKTGYVYKTTYNGVATSKMGLDKLFPGSQVNGGIIIAIIMAILVYIMLEKTTFGYELKACGANRHAARYAGIHDRRNIVCSMAIAGAMAGAAGGSVLSFRQHRIFLDHLPVAAQRGALTALPWRCWRSITPSGSSLPAYSCRCFPSRVCS